jgi:hypothetical protein
MASALATDSLFALNVQQVDASLSTNLARRKMTRLGAQKPANPGNVGAGGELHEAKL